MPKKRVIAIGGDGVGPEIVNATCYILEKAKFDLEIINPPASEPYVEEKTRQLCDTADAVLFGASGPVPGQPPRGTILYYLRRGLDNYANVRPVKYYPGANSPLKDPVGIDFVIVRELSEGMYTGAEGDVSLLREKLPDFRTSTRRGGKSFADFGEGKFAIRIITERGAKRIAKFACELTKQRKRNGYPGKLTCVRKVGVFPQTCGLFQDSVAEEVKKCPEITFEQYNTDDTVHRLVRQPKEFDVIVITNFFGDMLSDEAAALIGGLGMAPSGSFGGKYPYFEPAHGSAPKYTGKNVINPTATILSAKLMLDYFGMHQEADALEKAVAAVYKEGKSLTYDQGGKTGTKEFAQAVLKKIK